MQLRAQRLNSAKLSGGATVTYRVTGGQIEGKGSGFLYIHSPVWAGAEVFLASLRSTIE